MSEENCMIHSLEGGVGDEFVWAGQVMPGTNVPGQRGEEGLCREGQGYGYKGHIGIHMVREGV